ncbi:MAG: hypothetical protein Q8L37_07185 [Candidatus Gottesmanbacteria bacterium]|nr:hypothetical protein [Candidatus Gottesmanbacteria bacterium]
MSRRTVLLDRIYKRFATPEDLRIVDELYAKGSKGVAVRKMLQDILERLDTKEWNAEKARRIDDFDIPRLLAA